MKIRIALESDTPRIVELLKKSLGQSLLPKSEKIWNYKHLENPFGKSIVLLGEENGELVGVRAFMRWKWQKHNKVYNSLRAVDTATHPDHQGKGVFKRLTLAAIDLAKQQGEHLIFNTPNDQSLPGYLRMGWEKVDKLKVQLFLVNPIFWKFSIIDLDINNKDGSNDVNLQNLLDGYLKNNSDKEFIFTPKSIDYLKWRYENNPLQSYFVFNEHGYYIACYVKNHKYFNELRISEFIYLNKDSFKAGTKKIKAIAKKTGVQLIASHPQRYNMAILSKSGKFGPILTFRNINLKDNEKEFYLELKNWKYTLGDLELF